MADTTVCKKAQNVAIKCSSATGTKMQWYKFRAQSETGTLNVLELVYMTNIPGQLRCSCTLSSRKSRSSFTPCQPDHPILGLGGYSSPWSFNPHKKNESKRNITYNLGNLQNLPGQWREPNMTCHLYRDNDPCSLSEHLFLPRWLFQQANIITTEVLACEYF